MRFFEIKIKSWSLPYRQYVHLTTFLITFFRKNKNDITLTNFYFGRKSALSYLAIRVIRFDEEAGGWFKSRLHQSWTRSFQISRHPSKPALHTPSQVLCRRNLVVIVWVFKRRIKSVRTSRDEGSPTNHHGGSFCDL